MAPAWALTLDEADLKTDGRYVHTGMHASPVDTPRLNGLSEQSERYAPPGMRHVAAAVKVEPPGLDSSASCSFASQVGET